MATNITACPHCHEALTVTCPECGGTRIVEHSEPIRHFHDLQVNDWYTVEYPCERCNATGMVPAAVCEVCNAVVPAEAIEYGACPNCLTNRCFQ